jgi:predicted ATPase/class 3 adenylate cyclase
MSQLPTGTVTFLFTDIEGSTKLWEQYPEAMKSALAKHDAIMRQSVESNCGQIVKTTGDGIHAVFETAAKGVAGAFAAQQALQAETWDEIKPRSLQVRMGLHSGEAEMRAGDYYGGALNRAARMMSVGYGGQILISNATAALVGDGLPVDATLLDLGEHRLKDLARPEHVYQFVHPTLPSEFPPIKSFDTIPNNLPVQLTSFIGREKEIAEIKGLLNSARLVTLTGSGGTGKTRLAQEVSAQELSNFQDGVWLVELAPLASPAQIIPAMGQVFGLQELPFVQLAALVIDYLREKKVLLILDNCEHLVEACARLAEDLLQQCAKLKVIASSREALGIGGEVSYPIPSLAEGEAVQLFVERARLANPKFNMTDSNTSAMSQICSRLDGIPLAIELAAARTKLLSPEQIAARLDDRFRLLVGGSRTALPRQQTLRALIDWSYDLLSEDEKRLLQHASVFVGGWTLDALEAVADDLNAVEHLEQLINKSMVIVNERESEMRYFMLETIRQYGREKLFDAGLASGARDRHFAHFDHLSEVMWDAFRNLNEYIYRDRVYDEFENMRAALEWGLEYHPEAALRLAANLCIVSSWTGNQIECLALVKSALEGAHSLPPVEGEAHTNRQRLLAKALFAQGMAGMSSVGLPFAMQSLREAIPVARLAGDKRILGYSLELYYIASTFTNRQGDADAAREGQVLLSEIQDRWGMIMATLNTARVAAAEGDYEASQKYFGMVKESVKEAPYSFQTGIVYFGMGMEERARGHADIAKGYFEEGLNIFIRLKHKSFENVLKSELGHIARTTGDYTQAKTIYRQTIMRFQNLGSRPAIANQLECFAFIAISEGEPQRAARLLGAAEALRERISSQMTDFERVEYDQSLARLNTLLHAEEFNALWAEGRSMPMEQSIALALST